MADGRYDRGVELGCPDCLAFEIHCCPFLWADRQEEPRRSWILRHLRRHLGDVYAEGVAHG